MKRVLHVGCGEKTVADLPPYFADWQEIRVDLDPAARPDVVASMTDLSAVASSSVDAVFANHSLEHLYPHDVPLALREFRRVVNDDGFVALVVPDLEAAARMILEGKLHQPAYVSSGGPITAFDMIFGHSPAVRDSPLMAHKSGFTKHSLFNALKPFFAKTVTAATKTFNVRGVGFASRSLTDDVAKRQFFEIMSARRKGAHGAGAA
jgi:hypothetical protein